MAAGENALINGHNRKANKKAAVKKAAAMVLIMYVFNYCGAQNVVRSALWLA